MRIEGWMFGIITAKRTKREDIAIIIFLFEKKNIPRSREKIERYNIPSFQRKKEKFGMKKTL